MEEVDNKGFSQKEKSNNKKVIIIGIIIIALLIGVLGYIFWFSGNNSSGGSEQDCAGQGESFNSKNSNNPNKCCEGLDNIITLDMSIADKCYDMGIEPDSSMGICSDCGNGICEKEELVCGCSEDCVGKGKSDFQTIQEFCDKGYDSYCWKPESLELEICQLCG